MSVPTGLARRSRRSERLAGARAVAPILGAIVLLTINLRTVIAGLPPMLTDVRADLGLSAVAAGLLTALPVVCFGALAPLAPRLAQVLSLERVLLAAAALTAAGVALRSAGGVAALFAGTVVAGVATAVAQASLPVLIRARHATHTGLFTGAFSMALPLGATLASAVAVPLEHAYGGSWRASLATWALPALVAAVVWLPSALRAGTRISARAPTRLRRNSIAWVLAAFMATQSMAFYAGLAWLPTILESGGYTSGQAGGLQALGSLVSVVPAFLAPVLAARRPNQTALLLAIVALPAVGIAGLLAAPGAAPLWVVLLGLGQGGSLGLGMILPSLRAADAPTAAALMGLTMCVGYLVASTGPWLLGAAHDITGGWTVPLFVLLAMTLMELVPGLPAARARTVGSERSAGRELQRPGADERDDLAVAQDGQA